MWGKSAVGGTASKSQGGFFYPLDLIVVVSYFLVVDWCLVFGKTGRCVFKNIGKDCLFRPLSLSLSLFLQLWFRPRGDKLPFFCYLSIVASREERIQVILIF